MQPREGAPQSDAPVHARPMDEGPMRVTPSAAGAPPGRTWGGLVLRLATRAVLRPRLAVALLATAWAFRRRHWARIPPFLPLPSREYLRWRMYTAYGDEEAVPPAEDVIRFAQWRRAFLRL
jgi:hypothetical protein